jgi:integrase
MTTGSAARYSRVFESFTRYAAARGVPLGSAAVLPAICRDFVNAELPGRVAPSPSTRRFRLTVVRGAFQVLREAGLASSDPTRGLRVEWRQGRPALCPLTPAEARRIRVAGQTGPTDSLRPAVVTVALAGGSHREISEAVVADVDVEQARLRLPSGGERWRALDPAAMATFRTRIAAQRLRWRRLSSPWDPLVVPLAMHRPLLEYPASSVAATVSMNLSRALQRAGITRAGVRPRSVREFAANRTYALTGRVEDVAQLLGLASLDTAAGLLDEDWQDRWGPIVRLDAGPDG